MLRCYDYGMSKQIVPPTFSWIYGDPEEAQAAESDGQSIGKPAEERLAVAE